MELVINDCRKGVMVLEEERGSEVGNYSEITWGSASSVARVNTSEFT